MTAKKTPKKSTKVQADSHNHQHDHHDHNHDHDKTSAPSVLAPNTTFEMTIPWKIVAPAYDKQLKKAASSLKADGFRKGKVPTELAEQRLSTPTLIEEALNDIFPDLYVKEIEKRDLHPLTNPRVEPKVLAKGNDAVLKISIAEKPKVDVKDYKIIVKKAHQEGQKALKIAQQAESKKKTQTKQTAKETPQEKRAKEDEAILNNIYAALIQELHPQIPELLLVEEARHDLEQFARQLKQGGSSLDEYLKQTNASIDDLYRSLAAQALNRLQLMFILDAIAQNATLTVSDQEVDTIINQTPDEKLRKQQTTDQRFRSTIAQSLMRQKMVDYLMKLK